MYEAHNHELHHQKQEFFNKRKNLNENWRKKHAEILCDYEKIRGLRDDVREELLRVKELVVQAKIDFEEKVKNVEDEILSGEAKHYSRGLRQVRS